jgi:hypothetical protein
MLISAEVDEQSFQMQLFFELMLVLMKAREF